MSTTKAPHLKFNTPRQKQLLRVILAQFQKFEERGQPYYALEGMNTYHVTGRAIEDLRTLQAFWPSQNVKLGTPQGDLYQLTGDTIEKANSGIRDCLDQLVKLGYLEKLGNENERRWRPVKSLKGVTL